MKYLENYKISVIVPVYNEEKTVYSVLNALKNCSYIDEIICVNDGSSDNTTVMVKKTPGVKLVSFKRNHGKAYAIAHGIRRTIGDIIVFMDGDILGINDNTVQKLIEPLIKNKYDGTVGYPYCNHLDKLFYSISGERAYFRKHLIPHLKTIEKKGYGLELYLNYLFKDKKIKLIPLRGLKNCLKHEKQSFDIAAKLTLIEGIDLITEIIKQNNPMSHIIKSYFYNLYLDKPKSIDSHIDKLTKYIKSKLLTKLF